MNLAKRQSISDVTRSIKGQIFEFLKGCIFFGNTAALCKLTEISNIEDFYLTNLRFSSRVSRLVSS